MIATSLVEVDRLSVEFATEHGWVRVVEDLSFEIRTHETLGLVGESGSGKSVTALAILGLLPPRSARVSGSIRFRGHDLTGLGARELQDIRGREISMIFQEPMTSLNPAFTVGEQIAETVRQHRGLGRREAWARALEMLELVGIPSAAERAHDYPHRFSGGMRQRAMIAMALSCEPQLLIADEPTTALDATVQANVIELLQDLQERLGMAVLFVTHNLGVVADFCERVLVMYAGQIVESAPVLQLFDRPRHPYTEGLLRSMPQRSPGPGRLWSIPGAVPAPWDFPAGCRFHPRCGHSEDPTCTTLPIPLTADGDRQVRCARAGALTLEGTR